MEISSDLLKDTLTGGMTGFLLARYEELSAHVRTYLICFDSGQ